MTQSLNFSFLSAFVTLVKGGYWQGLWHELVVGRVVGRLVTKVNCG